MDFIRIPRCWLGALLVGSILSAPAPSGADVTLPAGFTLQQVAYGPFFPDSPVGFAILPDGRILMIERVSGNVRINAVGPFSSTVIHTIPEVEAAAGERGLLGIAVDPAWPTRPYLYFYFTHVSGTIRLIMLEASGDLSDPASTNVTLGSEYRLLTDLNDDTELHQAGTLRFGPDDMLYVSVGDDGWGCRAQDLSERSGKIYRLDVANMPGAGIGPPPKADLTPPDNPFPGPDENERLVWAWGVRNPFRFTIDAETGDLFFGDVGVLLYEELNHIPFAGGGGENFGWPRREGFEDSGNPFPCGEGNTFTDPIWAYPHEGASSIIGGPIYRPVPGSRLSFSGGYDGVLFAMEFFHGWIRRFVPAETGWTIAPPVPGQPSAENWGEGFTYWSDFQLGPDGALYLCHLSADFNASQGVFRIVGPDPTDVSVTPPDGSGRVLAFPNPASGSTGTGWSLVSPGPHSLTVVDAAGRAVRTLGRQGAGRIHWDGKASDGTDAPAGVYFFTLRDGRGTRQSGKVSLLR